MNNHRNSNSIKKHSEGNKTHGSSLFNYQEENEVVSLMEDYLKINVKPENIEPLRHIVTKYCQEHGIKIKGNQVSQKRVYKIVKNYPCLRERYYQEEVSDQTSNHSLPEESPQQTEKSECVIDTASFLALQNDVNHYKLCCQELFQMVYNLQSQVEILSNQARIQSTESSEIYLSNQGSPKIVQEDDFLSLENEPW
jgi:hypothetical protein